MEVNNKIALGGISNLKDIGNKFINFKNDEDSQKWLSHMGYDLKDVEEINFKSFFGEKPDLVLEIKYKGQVHKENILVKLINNIDSNNQLGKVYLEDLYEKWDIPDDIYQLLQWFTGEINPYKEGRDIKRMYLTEFSESDQKRLINWFKENKDLVSKDIFHGFDNENLDWMLIAKRASENSLWDLLSIDQAQEFFIGNEDISVTPWGSLNIGKVTMLRKGGNDETANMLIFRFRPGDVFVEQEEDQQITGQ